MSCDSDFYLGFVCMGENIVYFYFVSSQANFIIGFYELENALQALLTWFLVWCSQSLSGNQ